MTPLAQGRSDHAQGARALHGRRRGSVASVYVLNEDHVAVIVATPRSEHERSGRFERRRGGVFSFAFDNVLAPGRYSPMFTLAHRGSGLDLIDRFEGGFSFVVTGPERHGRDGRPAGRAAVSRTRSAATRGPAAYERRGVRPGRSEAGPCERLGRPIRGPRALTDDWRASGTSPSTSRATSGSCASSARRSAICGS